MRIVVHNAEHSMDSWYQRRHTPVIGSQAYALVASDGEPWSVDIAFRFVLKDFVSAQT